MIRLALFSCVLAATLVLPLHAASDAEVEARRIASELAGAFTNDGFRLRDGAWMGSLAPAKPQVLEVNLYAGNEYWFCVGTAPEAKKISITIHNEAGEVQEIEPFTEANRQAAGFTPPVSGPYYIRLEEQEGTLAAFCLLYSYK